MGSDSVMLSSDDVTICIFVIEMLCLSDVGGHVWASRKSRNSRDF